MIPPNWHIVDDESIMALMAEALRDARRTQSPPSQASGASDNASDPSGDPATTEPSPPPSKRRWRKHVPANVVPMLKFALLFIVYSSIPVLFFIFDAVAWSAFARTCNVVFEYGSGDVWAMQWIGWSQRHPIGLVGVFLFWIACGGGIMFSMKRNNSGILLKEMIGNVLKSIHDMGTIPARSAFKKASRAGER